MNWKQRLDELAQRKFKNYTPIRIDLSTARTRQPIDMSGDCLMVYDVSGLSAVAQVNLNQPFYEPLTVKAGTKIKTPFTTVYLTNTAQPGAWIVLLYGVDFDLTHDRLIPPVNPAMILTNAVADANTVAASHVCSHIILKSSPKNAGIIWVNFSADAVEDACFPLDIADGLDVKAANTGIVNALFKNAGDKLIILYE